MSAISKPWLIAALLSTTAIIVLNSLPGSAARAPSFPGADKIAHVLMYGGTAFSWRAALKRDRGSTWWLLAGLLAFAALDETRQRWVQGRYADVADWLADGIGVLLGIGAWHLLWRARPRA